MSEETQNGLKVYELAKELNIDSISLLDQLRGIDIVVKSHMSALTGDQVVTARSQLSTPEPAKKKKKAAKKKVVRKKTGDSKTAKSKKGSAAIIRRKGRDGEEAKASPSAEEEQEVQAAPAESTAAKTTTRKRTSEKSVRTTTSKKSSAAETPPAEPSAPIGSKKTQKTKDERKSFLKIVEPTKAKPITPKTAPKQQTSGASSTESPGAKPSGRRIIKMTKENLDKLAADEAARKRPGGRDATRPEDSNFSDYRKKEMVFLPRRKRIPVGKELRKTEVTVRKDRKRVLEMLDTISVQDLAGKLGVKGRDVIQKLVGMGQMVTINSALDFDTASLIASEYQWEIKNVAFKEESILEKKVEDKEEDLEARPPVITVMGHVDHGKTTLLDAIRDANVVDGEAGGITQHIGAYTIEKDGQLLTFIDTPGHEAFTAMRARGANTTDIVILVVAADDGVMPQTREAISHAQEAKVPIIVAVNKMDKPGANLEKAKQALAEVNLLSEDWGGDTIFVPISAKNKENLDKLLEAVALNAELLELKANPGTQAQGTILEARLEKGRGPVASVLLTRGTLKLGQSIVSGEYLGRVRAMMDALGSRIETLKPGMAAEILGLEGVPSAGDVLYQTSGDTDAKRVIAHRLDQKRAAASSTKKMSLDDLFSQVNSGNTKELKVVLKADVFGSMEAVKDSLTKLSNDQVKINVIHSATGGITESDVLLASASNAIIIGFNVRPEGKARKTAESESVEVNCYKIIYELVDEVKKSMTGLLDKKKVETFLGRAEVRQTFSVPKIGTIAGSAVIDGKIIRGASVRLLRDSVIVHEGKMGSLRRFKDDAKEVASGYECGIGIEGFNDIKPGDVIEAFQVDMVAQELE